MRTSLLASAFFLFAACGGGTGTPPGFYGGFDAATPATCSGHACACTSADPCTATCGNDCGIVCTGSHGCAA